MDKGDDGKSRWGWLPQFMPGVVRLLAERRRQDGADWVAECWQRGVIERQPGWFYAAEGALAVGVPWQDDGIAAWLAARITPTQVLLVMRERPADGAH